MARHRRRRAASSKKPSLSAIGATAMFASAWSARKTWPKKLQMWNQRPGRPSPRASKLERQASRRSPKSRSTPFSVDLCRGCASIVRRAADVVASRGSPATRSQRTIWSGKSDASVNCARNESTSSSGPGITQQMPMARPRDAKTNALSRDVTSVQSTMDALIQRRSKYSTASRTSSHSWSGSGRSMSRPPGDRASSARSSLTCHQWTVSYGGESRKSGMSAKAPLTGINISSFLAARPVRGGAGDGPLFQDRSPHMGNNHLRRKPERVCGGDGRKRLQQNNLGMIGQGSVTED